MREHCSASSSNDSSGDSFHDPSPPKMLAYLLSFSAHPLFTRLCLNAATQWGRYVFGRRTRPNEPPNSPLAIVAPARKLSSPRILASTLAFSSRRTAFRYRCAHKRSFHSTAVELSESFSWKNVTERPPMILQRASLNNLSRTLFVFARVCERTVSLVRIKTCNVSNISATQR